LLDFSARLVPSILRCLGSDLLVGIMEVALCIFVLDHDPQTPIRPPIEVFRLEPRFLVELGCDSIPNDLVRFRAQVLGHSIP
jgi:hypothetical protein